MQLILGTFLVLLMATTVISQIGNYAADYGIQAGEEITHAIGSKNFGSFIGKLSTKSGPYLGMVSPVIGLLFSELGFRHDSPELRYMRNMFTRIEIDLKKIDGKLNDISRNIDWISAQCHFPEYESNIINLQNSLRHFYEARDIKSLYYYRNDFINMYNYHYADSTQMLYKNIISDNFIFSGKLLKEIVRATDNDRRASQEFMMGIAKLILVGSQIDIAYYKLSRPTMLEYRKNMWIRQINNMGKAMRIADQTVAGYYKTGAKESAKKILRFYRGQSNEAMVGNIFHELSTKFYWRNWFVAVYNPVKGRKPHSLSVCGGGYEFRFNGYNLLLASNPEDTRPLNKYDALEILKYGHITRSNQWYSAVMTARDIFDDVRPSFNMCSGYSAFGVITLTADLHVKADRNRIVTHTRRIWRRGLAYELFLFR